MPGTAIQGLLTQVKPRRHHTGTLDLSLNERVTVMNKRIPGALGFAALLLCAPLLAQQHDHSADAAAGSGQGAGMQRGQGAGMQHGNGDGQGGIAMGGDMMQHREHMRAMMQSQNNSGIGQSAFDSIKAMVERLQANPDTDWSQVDIDRYHEHLVDMHHVTIEAQVVGNPVNGGARYQITGTGRTLEAIRRMVPMHSAEIAMETGWKVDTLDINDGIALTVTSEDPAVTARIRGLGFMGFMVQGDHHDTHHGIIAGAPDPAAADHDTHQH